MRLSAVVLLCLSLLAGPAVEARSACTSFVMDTPAGPFFGTNLDLFIPGDGYVLVNGRGVEKQTYSTGTTGKRAEWVSEYGSVTFTLVGREFAWGGMNEEGLALSTMELRVGEYPEPDERPAFFDGTWGQYILDTCSTIEDVIRANRDVTIRDQGYTSHYLVADRAGNTAAVEFIDGETVIYSGDAMPVKALSNMRYDRALTAYERGGPRWWWSNPGQSAERFAACQARAESYDASRDTSAVDYAFGTLTHVVGAPHTRWNIVFDLAGGQLWYRSAQSPTRKHISLDSFDFSCDAPRLMLDVNAKLEGDVAGHFVPYDPVENLRLFRTFCARYGIDVSEEVAVDLMDFHDSFECAD